MKITKRQLRRIIKEEKQKLLAESVTDMMQVGDEVASAANRVSGQFMELMFQLFDEDPQMFDGRSTEAEWEQQVNAARHALEESLNEVMNQAVAEIEMNLHDGAYHRGNR